MTSVDDRDVDHTFENEQSTVTIPLKEYDRLRDKQKYITDPSLISIIDKIEELTRELKKTYSKNGYRIMNKKVKEWLLLIFACSLFLLLTEPIRNN